MKIPKVISPANFYRRYYTVDWSWRKHRLSLSIEVYDYSNERSIYYTKQSDDEGSVMLELKGMQSTPSLPSLQGPL